MVVFTLTDRGRVSNREANCYTSAASGAGSSSAWQSTTFGTWGPEVQILSPRPHRMPRKRADEPPPESLEDRWLLEAQTARNLEAFAAEREGRIDDAIG